MAETVKNNVRKRRLPLHLREGYNQQHFDSIGNIFTTRTQQYRQNIDPCSISTMARLLSKFLNSVNKKLNLTKQKTTQQQIPPPPKPTPPQHPKFTSRHDRPQKQQKPALSQKIPENHDNMSDRQSMPNPQTLRQEKKNKIVSPTGSVVPGQITKQNRNQAGEIQQQIKNYSVMINNSGNIDSINRISQEQLRRLLPNIYDKNLLKQQLIRPQDHLPPLKHLTGPKLPEYPPKPSQFRHDNTKLFKRASFHVGIAYNIHIQNIREKNPNFSSQELDPTYIAKKIKQESEFVRKQMEEERGYDEIMVKNRQQYLQKKQQNKISENSNSNKKQNSRKKQPIYIDLDQEIKNDKKKQTKYCDKLAESSTQKKQKTNLNTRNEQVDKNKKYGNNYKYHQEIKIQSYANKNKYEKFKNMGKVVNEDYQQG